MIIPSKLEIANLPTPLQKVNYDNKSFFIKRDDFTGLEFSGNKIRKLEYLLYDAKKKGAKYVITCGGEQSNHARATVAAAASIGLKSKVLLWGNDRKTADGNLFLNKVFGAEIRYINKKEFLNVDELLKEEKETLLGKGINSYLIPEGGSSSLGIWGYIKFLEELMPQVKTKIDGILTASGSGGTSAGLLIAAKLFKINIKIFAVNVLYEKNKLKNRILSLAENCIREFNLKLTINENDLEIIEGYSEEGYKNITKEKISVINEVAQQTGILLDPTYTGKAFFAYNEQFLNNSKSNIIFVHTGGLFGVFAKRKNYLDALNG